MNSHWAVVGHVLARGRLRVNKGQKYREQGSNLHAQRALDPKSSVSTNSTIPAQDGRNIGKPAVMATAIFGEIHRATKLRIF